MVPTIPTSEVELENLMPSQRDAEAGKVIKRLWNGWQKGIVTACTCTIITLIINVSVYLWTRTKATSNQGTYVLFESDNDTTKKAEIWIHLVINILSTTILIGSNYTLQVLQSPTRYATNLAHKQHKSLCIGASSFKNWTFMSWQRKALYISMVILMLPLHLLYNSVIFSTVATFDTLSCTTIVTQDFQQLQPSNESSYKDIWESTRSDRWITMDIQECRNSIEKYKILSGYSNILFLANITGASQNSSYYYVLNATETLDHQLGVSWIGPGNGHFEEGPFEWPNTWLQSSFLQSDVSSPFWDGFYIPVSSTNELLPAHIESCLLEQADQSTIEMLPELLLTVIICNILKVIILILSMRLNFQPMVTIGDGIASFLDDPDPTTSGLAPLSVDVFRKSRKVSQRPWKVQDRRYFHGVARLRWILTLSLCFLFWAVLLIVIPIVILSDGLVGWNVNPDYHNPFPVGDSLFTTILVANTPQVILSAIYVYYNALFTFMLVSAEFVAYSVNRKGLRVSKPEGEQRSTYFLSLPLKYSIPLGAGSMLLHWLLSQGFYIIQINMFSSNGTPEREPGQSLLGMICAPLPMIVETIFFTFMVMTILLFSLQRYKSAIPFVGTDSIAISAACHSYDTKGSLSVQKIQYGVIRELPLGEYRVGFSNEEVSPLIPGQFYK